MSSNSFDRYLNWKSWEVGSFGSFRDDDAAYFDQELRACGVPSVSGLRIAEVGFGNGGFAGWSRSKGAQWVGCERIPELQERAASGGFSALPLGKTFAGAFGIGSFDLWVAFDVIEHLDLDSIRELLRDAKEALRPEGLIVFRIPSGDSPYSGAIINGDLTHRTTLGSSAIWQLAGETELEVLQVRAPVLPTTGLGLARRARRLAVATMQQWTFAYVRTVLMGNRNAVLAPNMIVVLKKPHTTS